MTIELLEQALAHIKFRNWVFVTGCKGDGFWLQVQFHARDVVTHELGMQKCRKWQISCHSTTQEVVRTAHKAILAAVGHEANEDFLYKGEAIYNPHISPDALVEVANKKEFRDG